MNHVLAAIVHRYWAYLVLNLNKGCHYNKIQTAESSTRKIYIDLWDIKLWIINGGFEPIMNYEHNN